MITFREYFVFSLQLDISISQASFQEISSGAQTIKDGEELFRELKQDGIEMRESTFWQVCKKGIEMRMSAKFDLC